MGLDLDILSESIKNGDTHAEALLDATRKRVDHVEDRVKSFVSTCFSQAHERSQAITQGQHSGPLAGIPIAIKDNINVKGLGTTCSSKMLQNYVAPYSATVVEKLETAGAVIIGKTNMDEFAMGSSTENSAFFKTQNPWNLECVPGGSSGGSAAAVSAGEAVFALGSDTGGSIRQPASFCGVVGLKPTYGRVSRYGLAAFGSSLDQIGPITRTVKDAAIVLNVIAGHDPKDSTSAKLPVPDYTASLKKSIKGLKIAVPRELYENPGVSPEVKMAFDKSLETYKQLGASFDMISMKTFDYALSTYYVIAPAEASANLERYDGVRFGLRADGATLKDMIRNTRTQGFGDEVKRRILTGVFVLSSGYYDAYYLKAQQVRTLIKQEYDKAFQTYDVIITPTAPTTAFKIGEKANDPLAMYLSDIMTIPVNMAGVPSISIPCGFADGLPIGLQLTGKNFAEAELLNAAYAFEQATEFHKAEPIL